MADLHQGRWFHKILNIALSRSGKNSIKNCWIQIVIRISTNQSFVASHLSKKKSHKNS